MIAITLSGTTCDVSSVYIQIHTDRIYLSEAPINAPSRIGMWRFGATDKPHGNTPIANNVRVYDRFINKKLYELTDQTGNVRVVITDRKRVNGSDEAKPDIAMSAQYYPYGMAQAGRVASAGADYRYGYNGMEEEDRGEAVSSEIASTGEKAKPGEANLLNTEFRLYDPRLGQWLTPDPVFQPWESPYSAMAGNPILLADPSGLNDEVDQNGGLINSGNNNSGVGLGADGALVTAGASGSLHSTTPDVRSKKGSSPKSENVLVSSVTPLEVPNQNSSPKTIKLDNGEVLYLTVNLGSVEEAFSYGREVGNAYTQISLFTSIKQSGISLMSMGAALMAHSTPGLPPIIFPDIRINIGLFGSESGKNYVMDYEDRQLVSIYDKDFLAYHGTIGALTAASLLPVKTPAGALFAKAKPVAQYSLRAIADGFYPVMERGFQQPQGLVWLNKDEMWKFGTTVNPKTRYTQNI
ncbi:MAG TPA: RHS repeat-associated core domain-containing protein [Candidatus Kapabacteria bacterium]|nr:RHS repeat-associated core domain-containing protein [Candidatus Kapabacteria bacterium]